MFRLGFASILLLATSCNLDASISRLAASTVATAEATSADPTIAATATSASQNPCGFELKPADAVSADAFLASVSGIWRDALLTVTVAEEGPGERHLQQPGLLIATEPFEFSLVTAIVESRPTADGVVYETVSSSVEASAKHVEIGPLSEDGFRLIQATYAPDATSPSACRTYALKATTLPSGQPALLVRDRAFASGVSSAPQSPEEFLELTRDDIRLFTR